MGGSVRVESEEGVGSKFIVTLKCMANVADLQAIPLISSSSEKKDLQEEPDHVSTTSEVYKKLLYSQINFQA